MEERKINNRNVILGIILMCGCVYAGAISTVPHQTELVTSVINIPTQFTAHEDKIVSQQEITVALQNNVGALDTISAGITLFKIVVIVSIAGIVLMLLAMTGLIPRFGGMGD